MNDSLDLNVGFVSQIQDSLISWFAEAQRRLPWRSDRDPYRILVSEVMLVQTTVAAVVPYFERFIQRFPDVTSLAIADESDVLKAWEGLGYYRRARQLHAAARVIVQELGGGIPADPVAVRALPGVGRYIGGAILSQAFDLPVPILEANSQRVLARLIAWGEDVRSSRSQARLWQCAERLVPATRAGDFNQGLMELGALVCVPREPRCLICPVRDLCQAHKEGKQNELPIVAPRDAPKPVAEAAIVAEQGGRVLLVQRGPKRLWEGFWEFPLLHVEGRNPGGRLTRGRSAAEFAEGFFQLTGLRVEVGQVVRRLKYSVTTHRVSVDIHRAKGAVGSLTPGPGVSDVLWADSETLAALPVTSPSRRIAASIRKDGTDDDRED